MSQPINIALVPLRGGSKSIPGKNIKPIAGKPLCAWSLEAAVNSGIFHQVIVSTDSSDIASVVNSLNLGVTVLPRPAELATDTASTEAVMLYVAEQLEFDVMTLVQATSPFVAARHFQEAYQRFVEGQCDSLLSAVRQKRFYWTIDGKPINYNPQQRPRRQDFAGVFMENGAFYMTKKDVLLTEKCRLGGRIGVYEMPSISAVEIDEEEDWEIVERLLLKHVVQKRAHHADIRLFVSDVDGVLTDAGMYYSEQGDELKKFNTRDGKGIELLRNAGIKTAFITSEQTELVKRRADKLKVDYLFQGKSHGEKLDVIGDICRQEGFKLEQVAYIGDDINCYESLTMVGLAACPADASLSIQRIPEIVKLSHKGGEGAVREFAEIILGL
ncbi:MAG: acylneuraminate cytidylyltransferase [Deltaproteobacteria bacterium]|jgi:N-acylneuraminate cytidylyltransferase|nr:acylneuraminate cytidylyltransferase [Deltaproteobacteria bacterium]